MPGAREARHVHADLRHQDAGLRSEPPASLSAGARAAGSAPALFPRSHPVRPARTAARRPLAGAAAASCGGARRCALAAPHAARRSVARRALSQGSQPRRIRLARHDRLQHRAAALAQHVGQHAAKLEVGVLEHLLNAQRWRPYPLDGRARSDVQHVTQQCEADAPAVTVAGVDGGRALVDAHDGADLRLQVAILEGHLLAAAEVVAVRPCRRRGAGASARHGVAAGGSIAASAASTRACLPRAAPPACPSSRPPCRCASGRRASRGSAPSGPGAGSFAPPGSAADRPACAR